MDLEACSRRSAVGRLSSGKLVATIIIGVGIVALGYQGISDISGRQVVDLGPLPVTKKTTNAIPLSAVSETRMWGILPVPLTRVVPPACAGAALLFFIGKKAHHRIGVRRKIRRVTKALILIVVDDGNKSSTARRKVFYYAVSRFSFGRHTKPE
jgi:hypothetical protein